MTSTGLLVCSPELNLEKERGNYRNGYMLPEEKPVTIK